MASGFEKLAKKDSSFGRRSVVSLARSNGSRFKKLVQKVDNFGRRSIASSPNSNESEFKTLAKTSGSFGRKSIASSPTPSGPSCQRLVDYDAFTLVEEPKMSKKSSKGGYTSTLGRRRGISKGHLPVYVGVELKRFVIRVWKSGKEDGKGNYWVDMSMAKKVKVMSSDNEIFEVEESVLHEWQPFKDMMEDIAIGEIIPLPNLCSKVLEQVIKYCSYHLECQTNSDEHRNISLEEIKNWDAEFLNVEVAMLLDLLNAADFLNIDGLLDLASQAVADMMSWMTPEEIRITFNIKNHFTPEEEEALTTKNSWAFCELRGWR